MSSTSVGITFALSTAQYHRTHQALTLIVQFAGLPNLPYAHICVRKYLPTNSLICRQRISSLKFRARNDLGQPTDKYLDDLIGYIGILLNDGLKASALEDQ